MCLIFEIKEDGFHSIDVHFNIFCFILLLHLLSYFCYWYSIPLQLMTIFLHNDFTLMWFIYDDLRFCIVSWSLMRTVIVFVIHFKYQYFLCLYNLRNLMMHLQFVVTEVDWNTHTCFFTIQWKSTICFTSLIFCFTWTCCRNLNFINSLV